MLTDELKPCPFCGMQPEDPDVGDYFVECPRCGVQGPVSNEDGRPIAKAEWNRRAIEAEVRAEAQEPAHWRAVLAPSDREKQLDKSLHLVGFNQRQLAESWIAEQKTFKGWAYSLEPLYTSSQPPAPCQKVSKEQVQECFDTANELVKLQAEVAELKQMYKDKDAAATQLVTAMRDMAMQINGQSAEIERLTKERDEWKAQFYSDIDPQARATIAQQAERIAEQDAKLSSSISWSGHNVYGDEKSIKEVRHAIHYKGIVPELQDTIKGLRTELSTLKGASPCSD